jgi:hypothetical protein
MRANKAPQIELLTVKFLLTILILMHRRRVGKGATSRRAHHRFNKSSVHGKRRWARRKSAFAHPTLLL